MSNSEEVKRIQVLLLSSSHTEQFSDNNPLYVKYFEACQQRQMPGIGIVEKIAGQMAEFRQLIPAPTHKYR